jgi:hypothetical protein
MVDRIDVISYAMQASMRATLGPMHDTNSHGT